MRKIEELIPADYNPRDITPEEFKDIESSLKEFGFVDAVIVNVHPERLNIIVGGHQRTKVWKAMGNTEVPTFEVSLPLAKEKELNIRLNKNTGHWDFEKLSANFTDIELFDWGFSKQEFTEMEKIWVRGHERMLGQEDDFSVPEAGVDTDIVSGDLFQIGNHRLLCGDSTDIGPVNRLMNGKTADAVVTDPPYNVDYVGKTADALKIKNDKMSDGSFYDFLSAIYTNLFEIMKPGAPIYVFHADSEEANFRSTLKQSGLKLAQCLIWVKNTMVMGRQDYHWKHEPILYGWKEGAAHPWFTDRKQVTILEFDRPQRSAEHPTMKPVKLISYLIGNSSKKGDIVVDLFGGGGSTMVSCEQTGRIGYLMELDPRFCQVIINRMIALNPNLPIMKNGVPYEAKSLP